MLRGRLCRHDDRCSPKTHTSKTIEFAKRPDNHNTFLTQMRDKAFFRHEVNKSFIYDQHNVVGSCDIHKLNPVFNVSTMPHGIARLNRNDGRCFFRIDLRDRACRIRDQLKPSTLPCDLMFAINRLRAINEATFSLTNFSWAKMRNKADDSPRTRGKR